MGKVADFLALATGAWYLASAYDQHVTRQRNREVADRDAKLAERDAQLAGLEARLAKLERKGKKKRDR